MKNFVWRKCRTIFLEAIFFAFEKTFFRVSVQNIFVIVLNDNIG